MVMGQANSDIIFLLLLSLKYVKMQKEEKEGGDKDVEAGYFVLSDHYNYFF